MASRKQRENLALYAEFFLPKWPLKFAILGQKLKEKNRLEDFHDTILYLSVIKIRSQPKAFY